MKNLLLPLLLCAGSYVYAQTGLSEGAKLLFKPGKTGLTPAQQNAIFKELGFKLSRDKKEFVVAEGEDYPFAATAYTTDLNKDKVPEIFVVYGNTFTSGGTGQSVAIFIKDAAGRYQLVLGVPSTSPQILTTTNKGYPDLLLGGPGFEYPVMRWDGKYYDNHRTIKDADYGKTKKQDLEDASKAYTNTL